MSGVSGACRKERPAKITSPIRSPRRRAGELGQHRARHLEPVARLEVGRLHAAGDVQREHDVPRLAPDLPDLVRDLRPRQRADQQHQRGEPERIGQAAPACPATGRRVVEEADRGKPDPERRRCPPAPEHPHAEGERHRQEQQPARVSEPHPSLQRRRFRLMPSGQQLAHVGEIGGRLVPAWPRPRELDQVRLPQRLLQPAAKAALAQARRQGPEQLRAGALPSRQPLRLLQVLPQHVGHRGVPRRDRFPARRPLGGEALQPAQGLFIRAANGHWLRCRRRGGAGDASTGPSAKQQAGKRSRARGAQRGQRQRSGPARGLGLPDVAQRRVAGSEHRHDLHRRRRSLDDAPVAGDDLDPGNAERGQVQYPRAGKAPITARPVNARSRPRCSRSTENTRTPGGSSSAGAGTVSVNRSRSLR